MLRGWMGESIRHSNARKLGRAGPAYKGKKWFKKAVMKRPPFTLSGWKKSMSPTIRRRLAISSRSAHLPEARKLLSASRALQALANVTRNAETKIAAKADAKSLMGSYYIVKGRLSGK